MFQSLLVDLGCSVFSAIADELSKARGNRGLRGRNTPRVARPLQRGNRPAEHLEGDRWINETDGANCRPISTVPTLPRPRRRQDRRGREESVAPNVDDHMVPDDDRFRHNPMIGDPSSHGSMLEPPLVPVFHAALHDVQNWPTAPPLGHDSTFQTLCSGALDPERSSTSTPTHRAGPVSARGVQSRLDERAPRCHRIVKHHGIALRGTAKGRSRDVCSPEYGTIQVALEGAYKYCTI